jgi:hypothetical protein
VDDPDDDPDRVEAICSTLDMASAQPKQVSVLVQASDGQVDAVRESGGKEGKLLSCS